MKTPRRPGTRHLIEIDELKELAHAQAESLAQHLLPNGRSDCGYWRVGSIAGEAGQSLAINLTGPMRGLWTDFSAPKGSPEYSGNMIQLVARVNFGGRIPDACAYLMSWLGLDHLDPERIAKEKARARKIAKDNNQEAARQAEQYRRRALGIYLSAKPIAGTPAEDYLRARGIDFATLERRAPACLGFHPEVYCKEADRKLPCMVAAVVNLEGAHVATHRTWLAERNGVWGKANLADPKKALGKYQGGFIPLWKGDCRKAMAELDPGTPVLLSEGIEDGLTAAIARPEHRVIAGISLSNFGAIRLPEQAGPLIILAQRDPPGSKAADALERAVARHQEAGREVRLAYPPPGVKDVNELATADRDLPGEGPPGE